MNKLFALLAALTLAACGTATVETGAPGTEDDGSELQREVASEGLLAFVNNPATDVETLDVYVGLDLRAARNIVAARPYATLEQLDAVPYVGPVTFDQLERFAQAIGFIPHAAAGSFDAVAFTAAEAETTVEIVNLATSEQLSMAGLDARQIRNVLAARPIASGQQLAAIPYVGTRTMQDLKAFVAVWTGKQLIGDGALYDGVRFGPTDRTIALEILNNATYEQLVVIGGLYQYGSKLTIAGRPYADIAAWSATRGIGHGTSEQLLGYTRTGRWTRVASSEPGLLSVSVEHTDFVAAESTTDGEAILGINGDAGRVATWTLTVDDFTRTGSATIGADGWVGVTVAVPADVVALWEGAQVSVAYAE